LEEAAARSSTIDMAAYRSSPDEVARIDSLLKLLPARSDLVLEIGARDGHITRRLCGLYPSVVALDLSPVRVSEPRCHPLVANLVRLPFGEDEFDAVVCAEVLEHIPPELLEQACRELVRVTRACLVVGVPFEQDLRIGRTTCPTCGARNPPWSHRTTFTKDLLSRLFAPMRCRAEDLVGRQSVATNPFSAWILDRLGNPWGTYSQEEPCVTCGEPLRAPSISPVRFALGKFAVALMRVQTVLTPSKANWIHLAFEKPHSS